MSLRNLRTLGVFAVLAFGVGACADREIAGPEPGAPSVSTAVQLSGGGPSLQDPPLPGHLVLFEASEGAPAGLEAAVAALGGTIDFVVPQVGFASVTGLDDAGVTALAARGDLIAVEPDIVIDLDLPDIGAVAAADLDLAPGIHTPADPSTSFFFPRQWHHRAIGAHSAWAAGELGSPGVTVAILDTGIDYLNIDLAGLVDVSRSVSFVPADHPFVDAFFPGRAYFTDLHFHGTHVASTVSSNALAVSACVSATGPSFAPSAAGPFINPDTPAGYSNFGRSAISVAAPGGTGSNSNPNLAGGWVWQACSQTSLQIPICQTGIFTLGLNGTSMASPHAAGVAAILARHTSTAGQLRSHLQQTADDLGRPGADPFYGKGRVNAATATGAH